MAESTGNDSFADSSYSCPFVSIRGSKGFDVMSTLIKNGRIVTASDDYVADIFIDGETVSAIGRNLPMKAERTIDASNRLVIPGGIDPHVHMELPFGGTVSSDDFKTGTIAAAFGGTTTIIDFAIQSKGMTMTQAHEAWHAKSEGKCAIDYGWHMAITKFENSDRDEMKRLYDAGVTTFKIFLAYPNVLMIDQPTVYRVMKAAGELGGLTLVHAENGEAIEEKIKVLVSEGKTEPKYHAISRPPVMQADGVARALKIGEFTK